MPARSARDPSETPGGGQSPRAQSVIGPPGRCVFGACARAPSPRPALSGLPPPPVGPGGPQAGADLERGAGALASGPPPCGRVRSHCCSLAAPAAPVRFGPPRYDLPRATEPPGVADATTGPEGGRASGTRGPARATEARQAQTGAHGAPLGRRRAAHGPPPWRAPRAAAGPTEARNQHQHSEGRGRSGTNCEALPSPRRRPTARNGGKPQIYLENLPGALSNRF